VKAKNRAAVSLGRKGGKTTSDAKAKAARENGKKGGRPAKDDDKPR
jgi:general stress protein YciG